MKRIVLIQPMAGYLESFQDAPLHPLALLSVASLLVDEYEICIVDQRFDHRWRETLEQQLRGPVACVGVTTMTGPQIRHGLEASRVVRQHSRAPIVWGGIHAGILPAETVAHPLVDFVVAGEGEIAFRDLVHALDRRGSVEGIPGVWTFRDGRAAGTPSKVIEDLGILPPLPYHLVEMERYIGHTREGLRRFAIKTSRGCPNRCYFCHQTEKKDRRWRAVPAEKVLDEMAGLMNRHGIRCFHILDDSFFVDLGRVEALLRGIVACKWRISYVINGTRVQDVLRMSDDLLALLALTGCAELQLGLESGSQAMLDLMNKSQTLEEIRQANARLRRFGIPRYYELIAGHRGEGLDDLRQTARLILDLSSRDPGVFFAPIEILTPYPGTGAFRQAQDAGFMPAADLAEWSESRWDRAALPWIDRRRRRLLERFHIFPLLISSRIKTEYALPVRLLFALYRPIARWRVRHLCFMLPLELPVIRLIGRVREFSRRRRARPAGMRLEDQYLAPEAVQLRDSG